MTMIVDPGDIVHGDVLGGCFLLRGASQPIENKRLHGSLIRLTRIKPTSLFRWRAWMEVDVLTEKSPGRSNGPELCLIGSTTEGSQDIMVACLTTRPWSGRLELPVW
jgi:hypothetical protein